jgi:hypothetical protein
LLVYQRLHGNAPLSDAVAHFLLRFPTHARPDCKRLHERTLSANTAAYSQARSNLDPGVVDLAARTVFDTLVDAYPPSWQGRRAFILDGTTLSLAPTDELRNAFPPASNQHGRSHWPVLHMVVAHELASGLAAPPATGAMYGPDAVGEVDLAESLLAGLPERSDTSHGLVGEGPNLSPSRLRSRLAPSSAWIFQPALGAPATTKRDQAGPSPRRT